VQGERAFIFDIQKFVELPYVLLDTPLLSCHMPRTPPWPLHRDMGEVLLEVFTDPAVVKLGS
jgi:hypothetical protein